MTDTHTSGDTSAPAADTSAPAAHAATPAGNFGSTRGSGLARGKRPSGAAAPTATPPKADYKPTAVQVIVTQREYQNPFASPEPAIPQAEAPAIVESPAPIAVEPAPQAQAAAHEAPAAPEPVAPEPPSQEPAAEKAEIQILPPAEAVRPAVSWESPSAAAAEQERPERAQRDDRPTFRPDRRPEPASDAPQQEGRGRRFESRDPRRERDPYRGQPRDPRDEDPQFESRPRRDPAFQAPSAPVEAPKPKGFVAWLKGLFGSKPAETAVAPRPAADGQFGDGQRHRRRHRGGRGHGGGQPGFRAERPEGPAPGAEFDNGGGDSNAGPRRRRHRGGRGRDRGGDYRSEGKQGGGAI